MENSNPFSICFNMLKLKYSVYDASISELDVLKPTDKINVFLNIETVLKYLSTVRDLEQKLILNRDYPVSMIADFINLAAHYKEFFKNNGLDTKVFLYMTDLDSETEQFHECQYNVDYRCYYLNKYNGNPKYAVLCDGLKNRIFPKLKDICDFIPDVYFIKSKNIDGSLIPYIVSEDQPDRKNFIVSGDNYETQYSFLPNFTHHLFKRHFSSNSLSFDVKNYLKTISKHTELPPEDIDLYKNYGFFTLLLACNGETYRCIDKVNGVGYSTLTKKLRQSINTGELTSSIENINILSNIFDDKTKEDVIENYNTISLKNSITMLLDGEKKEILSQVVDRIDLNSLMKLNNTLFQDNRLRIESLLK